MSSSTSNLVDDLFHSRSKSYDSKLNYDDITAATTATASAAAAKADLNMNNFDLNDYPTEYQINRLLTQQLRQQEKQHQHHTTQQQANQAQITITSFAPENSNSTKTTTTNAAQPHNHRPHTTATAAAAAISSSNNNPSSDLQQLSSSNSNSHENHQTSEPKFNRNLSVIWPNGKSNYPLIVFNPKVIRKTCWECKKIGEQYHLSYKFLNGDRKLVRAILDGHGFRECHPSSSEFNLIWSGNNLKSYAFRTLQENQKVNHFPRSCELTRKDRLYKNVQRMQKEKGFKAFNIIPTTFIMPFEIDEFYNTFYREKGIWIVKPASLSRGRGIFLISHPDQIPLDDNLVVSKYVSNPLLIEGFKFDLRLYVAVTSFDPLVFYLYNEGLTRFATIKYDQNLRNIKNTCMHLTNYSVNKKNDKYVRCNDPDVEDYGNKWSMSALLRFLSAQGKDTFTMMMQIEEVIIKTLLSVESPLASASRMFMPHRGNCFELFGFDILIDEDLRPWVLEVNLSPSLDCDAVLDVKVKSNMIADLFTLAGVSCQNPNSFSNRNSRIQRDQFRSKSDYKFRSRPHSANMPANGNSQRPGSSNGNPPNNSANNANNSNTNNNANVNSLNNNNNNNSNSNRSVLNLMYEGLSQTEQTILKNVMDENARANGWVRLFPTSDTWEFYSQYMETRSTSYNAMIHRRLYSRRWISGNTKKATQTRAKSLQILYEMYKQSPYNMPETSGAGLLEAIDRYRKYEKKLNDNVRPNEDTLKRLTSVSLSYLHNSHHHHNQHQQHKSSNFNIFPNGDHSLTATTNRSANKEDPSSDLTLDHDGEDSSMNGEYYSQAGSKSAKPPLASQSQLAYINSSNRRFSKSALVSRNSMSTINLYRDSGGGSKMTKMMTASTESLENDSDSAATTGAAAIDGKSSSSTNNTSVNYTLDQVLKNLDRGFYMSKIQVREAFAMYLIKIQMRLASEAQAKDDSNIQQMELVLRFIKKAAPNLSQEFKVFVPSKRLPLNEQKRMLAKQLHDFLHIYRKDTEQICVDDSAQLENERKKHKNKLFNETALKNLLYKCSESELEEIMSGYMKNYQDSSVFLGSSSTSAAAVAASKSKSKSKDSSSSTTASSSLSAKKSSSTSEIPSSSSSTKKQSSNPDLTTSSANVANNETENQRINKTNKQHRTQQQQNKNYLTVNTANGLVGSSTPIQKPTTATVRKLSGDDLSGLSCDSHSIFSESESSAASDDNEDQTAEQRQQQQKTAAAAADDTPKKDHHTVADLPSPVQYSSSTNANNSNSKQHQSDESYYKIHLPNRKANVTNVYKSYQTRNSINSSSNVSDRQQQPNETNNDNNKEIFTTTLPINLRSSATAAGAMVRLGRKFSNSINELAIHKYDSTSLLSALRRDNAASFRTNNSRNYNNNNNNTFNNNDLIVNDEATMKSIYLMTPGHRLVTATNPQQLQRNSLRSATAKMAPSTKTMRPLTTANNINHRLHHGTKHGAKDSSSKRRQQKDAHRPKLDFESINIITTNLANTAASSANSTARNMMLIQQSSKSKQQQQQQQANDSTISSNKDNNNNNNNSNHNDSSGLASSNDYLLDSELQMQHQQVLTNGLRNLALKHNERIYSAKSTLYLASPLNQQDSADSDLNTPTAVVTNAAATANGLSPSSNKLIDQLKLQKERTSKLLMESRAKHDEILMNDFN